MDWDLRYQEHDTPWDKGDVAPILLQLLEERPALFQSSMQALVPGCGSGYDAFALAKHGIQTTGFDISTTALTFAAENFPHKNVTWQQGDIFCDLPDHKYDTIWEHTCFCAILPEQRDAYVQTMARTLKPKGFLIGVFFIETGMEEGKGPPFKASIDTIKQHFFSHFSLEYQLAPKVSYPGREGKEHLFLFRRLDN